MKLLYAGINNKSNKALLRTVNRNWRNSDAYCNGSSSTSSSSSRSNSDSNGLSGIRVPFLRVRCRFAKLLCSNNVPKLTHTHTHTHKHIGQLTTKLLCKQIKKLLTCNMGLNYWKFNWKLLILLIPANTSILTSSRETITD